MNEIIQKNEGNDFLEYIEKIKEELEKDIKNIESMKEIYNKEEINNIENSIHESTKSKKSIKLKKGKINIHISLFIPVLQFLDIKSLNELSRINHLFYSFVYSFYFYRYAEQLKKYSNKEKSKNKLLKNKKENISSLNDNRNNQNQVQTGQNNIIIDQTKKLYSSFMSAITGAINYINPTSIPTPVIKSEKKELEEIEKKIALHERLIDGRIKQVKLYQEINSIQKEIELYINRQNIIKNHKEKNKVENIMKKEDYEEEYKNLIKEIKGLEIEFEEIKKENEKQNNNGIELDNQINKIKILTNNIE